ncbi:MAG: M50 family metallopeptidase [bacterium]|nr:M50 family metallopeptidase [bacterium]
MFLTVLISLGSLIILISLHELGHFLTAKKFGIRVEEFGLGYPPRLWGKKIGDTIYSINLLPFGAFVRIPEREDSDPLWQKAQIYSKSSTVGAVTFTDKPLWQRMLVIFNGALVFWLVAIVIFSAIFTVGAPVAIDDSDINFPGAKIVITNVASGSPAQTAGLKAGDSIKQFLIADDKFLITTVSGFQNLVDSHKGELITFEIQRGAEVLMVSLTPRETPPADQGPIGISLARVGLKSYPLWIAPWEGLKAVFNMTWQVIVAYVEVFGKIFQGKPTGLSLVGPVGIVGFLGQSLAVGWVYFLQMIGAISIQAAILNLLPIPAFDGGKILFLSIEAIRRKPVSRKIEEKITGVFFILLIIMMIFVSIKDMRNLIPFNR